MPIIPPPPSFSNHSEPPKKQPNPEENPSEPPVPPGPETETPSEDDFTVRKIVGSSQKPAEPASELQNENNNTEVYEEDGEVEEEVVTYKTPSPRVRTIFRITTIANITMLVIGLSLAGIQLLTETGTLKDFFWVPTQEQVSNYKIIFWAVFFFSIIWAVGMIKTTTAHNRVLLQPWLEQQYGWDFDKHELNALGTEDMKAYKENHRNGTYQSEILAYQSPLAEHRLVIFIQNDIPVLIDLNTGQPMERAVDMYERHLYLDFKNNLWKYKNNVVFTLFTMNYKGTDTPFASIVWSDAVQAKTWIERKTEEGFLSREAEAAIVRGTLDDYFEHFNDMIIEHNDIKERGLLVGMGTEDAEVFFLPIEEFKSKVLGEK